MVTIIKHSIALANWNFRQRKKFHILIFDSMYELRNILCYVIVVHKQNTEWILNIFQQFRLDIGPSVSLGICLPAVCSTKHLEMLINKIYRTESDSSVIEIPPNACQFEENASNLMTLDLIAM